MPLSVEPIPDWAVRGLVEFGARLDSRGWCPATSGNLSVRLSADRVLITRSGRHKGWLQPEDLLLVDSRAHPLRNGDTPSAETALHCALYRRFDDCGAVLHGHSVPATVLSREGDRLHFQGFEIGKAFPAVSTHLAELVVPSFDNEQDMPRLAARIDARLADGIDLPGYLLRGHGAYAWGKDLDAAWRHLEALEFLLSCELERRRLP